MTSAWHPDYVPNPSTSFQPHYYHLLPEEHKNLYLYSLQFNLLTVALRWLVQRARTSHTPRLLSPACPGPPPSLDLPAFAHGNPTTWPSFYFLNMPRPCLPLGLCTYHSLACSPLPESSQVWHCHFIQISAPITPQREPFPNYSVEFIYHYKLSLFSFLHKNYYSLKLSHSWICSWSLLHNLVHTWDHGPWPSDSQLCLQCLDQCLQWGRLSVNMYRIFK